MGLHQHLRLHRTARLIRHLRLLRSSITKDLGRSRRERQSRSSLLSLSLAICIRLLQKAIICPGESSVRYMGRRSTHQTNRVACPHSGCRGHHRHFHHTASAKSGPEPEMASQADRTVAAKAESAMRAVARGRRSGSTRRRP